MKLLSIIIELNRLNETTQRWLMHDEVIRSRFEVNPCSVLGKNYILILTFSFVANHCMA